MAEDNNVTVPKKEGFFRKLMRTLRNLLILGLILVPIGYSA